MRSGLIRGAVVLVVVASLAVPAHALPRENGPWFSKPARLIKAIKHWVFTTFGDDMSVPKP